MVVQTVNFDPTKSTAASVKDGAEVIDELLNAAQIIPEKDKEEVEDGDLIISRLPAAQEDALRALEDELEMSRGDDKILRIKVKELMGVLGSGEPQLFMLQPNTTFGEFFIDVSCRFNIEIGRFDILYQTKDGSYNLAAYPEDQTFEAIAVIPCPDKTYAMCLEVVKNNKKRKSKDIFNSSGNPSVEVSSSGSHHDVDLSYASALELSPVLKRDFVGLKNRNMTCYLNSFLQGLFFTPEFRNVIYNYIHDPSRSSKKSICEPLQKLFLLLQLSIRDSIDTDELIRTFGWADRETWMQHDIEELFSIVMESITKELVGTPLDGIIQALYFGTLYDYVKCLECNRVSQRTDAFLVVPLPIRNFGTPLPSPTLEAALNSFVAYEVLDGSNMYNCSQCAKPCNAHKGFKFDKLPYILTFQLKRFEYDFVRDKRFKLNDKVIFPFVLDMNPYIETPGEDRREALKTEALKPKTMVEGTERKGHTRPSVKPMEEDETEDEAKSGAAAANERPTVEMMQEMVKSKGPEIYQLYGVMVHRGGINSGHYFAYIMDFERGKWYRCDDAVIRQASLEDIQSTYGGDREEDKELTSAYMLLYRRFDPELNLLPYYLHEMPAHMQAMWTDMDQVDKALHEEEELAKNAIKMTCFAYAEEGTLLERTIQIPKNLKFSEAAKYVREDFGDEVPLKPGQVRLVRYDRDLEIIENSFDGCEEDFISVVMKRNAPRTKNEGLLLEWKPDDGTPFMEVYKTSDLIFRAQKVDCVMQEMSGGLNEIHVDPGAGMGELKQKIKAHFGLASTEMTLVAQYNGRYSTLFGDDQHPLSLFGFDKINNLYVNPGSGGDELSNRLLDFVEQYTTADRMHMYIQLPDGFTVENLRNAKKQVAAGATVPAQIAPKPTESQQSLVADANNKCKPDVGVKDEKRALKLPNGDATEPPAQEVPGKVSSENEQSTVEGSVPTIKTSGDEVGSTSVTEPLMAPKRPDYFIKMMSAMRAEQDNLALCEIRIDGQTPLYALSKRVSSWISIPENDFVLYKIDKDESTEMRRMTERISTIKPFDHLYVKLEHRLQDGEARLPVYKLNLGSISNPLEYLSDIVVTMAISVDAIKAAVIEKSQICNPSSVDLSKVRIRKKIRTNPSKVLRPNTKLQDVFTASSIHCGEIYVQFLDEPCTLTDKTYCLIYRYWHPSTGALDPPKEITVFHDYSTDFEDVLLAKLKESMGVGETDTDFEVEVAKPDGIGYPWQMSPRLIQDLAWFPLVPPVRKSLYVYSDELVLLVRNKNEVPMEFGDMADQGLGEDDMEAYRPKNILKSLPVVQHNDRRETGLKLNLSKSPAKP